MTSYLSNLVEEYNQITQKLRPYENSASQKYWEPFILSFNLEIVEMKIYLTRMESTLDTICQFVQQMIEFNTRPPELFLTQILGRFAKYEKDISESLTKQKELMHDFINACKHNIENGGGSIESDFKVLLTLDLKILKFETDVYSKLVDLFSKMDGNASEQDLLNAIYGFLAAIKDIVIQNQLISSPLLLRLSSYQITIAVHSTDSKKFLETLQLALKD